ncbi:MAG: hypothetical protein IT378_01495 [Sandaracinaceae bacterium]|nr:hypothetical protein [Sandaracinaceae bacterium]
MPERFEPIGMTVTHEARLRAARWLLPLPLWTMPLTALLAWSAEPAGVVGIGALLMLELAAFSTLAMIAPSVLAWLLRTDWLGHVDVRLTPEHLLIDHAYPTNEIGVARLATHDSVQVTTPTHELDLRFSNGEDAVRFVRALSRAARERRAYELTLRSGAARLRRVATWWTAGIGVAALALLAGPEAGPASILAILGSCAAWARDERVFVGADGIEVRGWRRRYFAYRDIERVDLLPTIFFGASTRVVVVLRDGRHISLGRMEPARAEIVASILSEGIRMVIEGRAAGDRVSQLERDASESAGDWQARVSLVTQRGAGYREHAVDPERLALLMRNPASDNEQRVAAALALRANPSALAKIRVAADVSAEPRVARLLELVSDDSLEDAALEHALRRAAR